MLWTIVIILLILWLLGFISGTGGGLVHILLVVALIVLVFRLLRTRRRVSIAERRIRRGMLHWRGTQLGDSAPRSV